MLGLQWPSVDLIFEPVQYEEDSFEALNQYRTVERSETVTRVLTVVHFNSFSKDRSNFWAMSGWSLPWLFHKSFHRCKSMQPEFWQSITIPISLLVTGLVLANPMMIWFKELSHPKADCTCNLLGSPDQLTGGPDKWQCFGKWQDSFNMGLNSCKRGASRWQVNILKLLWYVRWMLFVRTKSKIDVLLLSKSSAVSKRTDKRQLLLLLLLPVSSSVPLHHRHPGEKSFVMWTYLTGNLLKAGVPSFVSAGDAFLYFRYTNW